jgi:hypothetical protein
VSREHRLLGVDDQVEQHLLQLMAISQDLRQPGSKGVDDRDVRDTLLVGAERQCLANDLIDVHHDACRLSLACEGEEVADDPCGPLRLAQDGLDAAPH